MNHVQTASREQAAARTCYLDNLKVFLTLLVILFHAVIAYTGPQSGWPYQPSMSGEYMGAWTGNFMSVCFSFFMPLFFFVSGYFTPAALDRHGTAAFLWRRLLRLGVPMLFVTVVLSLLTGHLEVGHGWYLQHLLLYSALYAVVCRLFPRPLPASGARGPSTLTLLLLFAGLTVANRLLKSAYPSDQWYMIFGVLRTEPNHLAPNVLMFIAGMVAFRRDWLSGLGRTLGRSMLALGLLLSAVVFVRPLCPALDAFTRTGWYGYEALMCVSLCFGLLALFRERCNTTSAVLRWLARQSYGVYVFHLLILLGLQQAFDRVYMGGGMAKFLFLAAATTALSLLLTWLVRLLPGVKRVL